MEPIFDESSFQKELSKYKVVRPADYHKSRISRSKHEQKARPQIAAAPVSRTTPAATAAASASSDFWELFSAANSSALSASELTRLLEAVREEQTRVTEKVNLHDLETIAAHL